MKPMLGAFAAIFVIAILAGIGLDQVGFSSEDRTSGDAVRLAD